MNKTYCNPLSIPHYSGSGTHHTMGIQSLGDPMLFSHEGVWYLYASAAAAWSSKDLVHWTSHAVKLPFEMVAPAILSYRGRFYLSGNSNQGLLRADHPLGPWTDLGPILNFSGKRSYWVDPFFFADDDGRVYLYHNSGAGIGTDGVFVTELDPSSEFTRAKGPAINLFAYDRSHTWERWGDRNEFPDVSWIEAPWVTKHNGRYYLQYSACGTEWDRYAVGLYTGEKATGPFVYDSRSPILTRTDGLLRGPGHHATVWDDRGNHWIMYHVLMRNSHNFDRRLALDPVGFDDKGRMVVKGPNDMPQFIPGIAAAPAIDNGTGWALLSSNKPVDVSSLSPGREARYCVDSYPRTWWQAAAATLPQTVEINLEGVFKIRAIRMIFSLEGYDEAAPAPYQYLLEVSSNSKEYRTIIDRRDNTVLENIVYCECDNAEGRYVRLTVTGAPSGVPVGIIDFSVFGEPR